jgi:hypothetical protein
MVLILSMKGGGGVKLEGMNFTVRSLTEDGRMML